MPTPRPRIGALLLVWPAVLVCLTLAAAPVMADTELGHTGKVGDHYLNDSSGAAGVLCIYDTSTGWLTGFDVNEPNIWARDTTASRDHQQVGWRFLVRRKAHTGASFKAFAQSPIAKARAYDNQSAYFPHKTLSPALAHDTAVYKVRVKMFWYRNGSVEGTALHAVDFYDMTDGPITKHSPTASCGTQFSNS